MFKKLFTLCFALLISTCSFGQIEVSGPCFGGTITLPFFGIVDGKEAFDGIGTVAGMPNIQVSVYWIAGSGWVLAFSGQPFYLEPDDTTNPKGTSSGNWTALGGAPCPIGEITIAGPSVLPVELTHFKGVQTDDSIILDWETASEIDNFGFEIARKGEGGAWSKIGFVRGSENSSQAINYQFEDRRPSSGRNYYRLRQVDFDGDFEYSKIIQVEKERQNGTITVFPNPVQDIVNVGGHDFVGAKVSIYNHVGKLIKKVTSSTESISVDSSEFPKGSYILEVKEVGLVFVDKFIKI